MLNYFRMQLIHVWNRSERIFQRKNNNILLYLMIKSINHLPREPINTATNFFNNNSVKFIRFHWHIEFISYMDRSIYLQSTIWEIYRKSICNQFRIHIRWRSNKKKAPILLSTPIDVSIHLSYVWKHIISTSFHNPHTNDVNYCVRLIFGELNFMSCIVIAGNNQQFFKTKKKLKSKKSANKSNPQPRDKCVWSGKMRLCVFIVETCLRLNKFDLLVLRLPLVKKKYFYLSNNKRWKREKIWKKW